MTKAFYRSELCLWDKYTFSYIYYFILYEDISIDGQ